MNLHLYFAAGGRYRGRLALTLLAGAILAGCATPRPDPTPTPEPEEERPEVVDLPAEERAPALINEAWTDPQPDKVRAAIDAVLSLDEPDDDLVDRADALWRDLDAQHREPLADRVRGARIAAARGEWETARERLGADAPDDETRTPEVYREGLALHARLLEHERAWYQALDARLRLDSLLVLEPEAQTTNQERIWGLLAALRPAQRDRLAGGEHPDAEPWVQLFAGLRGVNSDEDARRVAGQWRERYPSHPANSLLPELVASHPLQTETPDTILVLLPLSGDLAQLGNAILDGITRAYYAETGGQGRLVVRDTRGDPETAVDLYRRGIEEGADRVIGPLNREAARAVASIDQTQPTLLLNRARLDDNGRFGTLALNPEEDAYAVVDRAMRAGWRNPLVILPEGEFGDRIADAYQKALADYGLRPRDIVRLRPDADDISARVGSALGIEQSEARIREVARRTGLSLEGDPQVRGDADHLFVTGTSRQMRQLVPYLHFHGARQLPIMATPHIYPGRVDANRDRDLNGIVFPDAPYLLATVEPLNGEMAGASNELPRFVALGMDALRLSLHDRAVRDAPHHQLIGGAGTWSLNPVSGDWVREPAWARFESGAPRQLGSTSEGN